MTPDDDVSAAPSPRSRTAPSIRRRLGSVLATLGLLVAALFVVTSLQLRASSARTQAENDRNTSFRLADSVRQSSNDLTRMVRLYVSTGETRFRRYYDEILAIRAGTSPRPRGYDSSFWDRVLAEGTGFVEYDEPTSLVDQMRAADFTGDEFDALNAALDASNELAILEVEVMDRVAPRVAEGVDTSYFQDVGSEYERLTDQQYLTQKGVIMEAIGDFIRGVEVRTLDAVDRARSTSRTLNAVQIGILLLTALAGIAAMVRATRIVLRPLRELGLATRQLAQGDYQRRVGVGGVAELELLSSAFNTMAAAVESDVARRELAEQDARQARLAAEDASRAKSTFLAAMSHEIRTPMIGVTGMLEVLAETKLTVEQRSMVDTAQGSAQMLLQIIGDVLDLSKIEAGRLELAPAPFMIRPLVEAAAQTYTHAASAKGLRVRWTVDDDVAAAHLGDVLRIRQILSNFLSNAVKFTSTGSVALDAVVVGGDGAQQRLELSVADTGPGIPPEKQRVLFQEFAQADASVAGRSGGTGLGLVICRRLAALMGGDVTMDSTIGRGTTMRLTVELPVVDPADVGAIDAAAGTALLPRRPKPSREEAEREGSVLLLAEDNPINRRVLVHQLDIIGFHVDIAEDGQQAYDLFTQGRYALVFTDLSMPVMDGFELGRAIRRHETETHAPRTPLVALSANVLPGEAERCVAEGLDDFVGKPAPMPVLAATIRRWLPELEWPTSEPAVVVGKGVEPESSTCLVDRTVLHDLTGGDDELADAILGDYVASTRSDLVPLNEALAAERADDLRRQAHRIKGASQTVGAVAVAALASSIEASASGAPDEWRTLRTLGAELEAAVTAFAAAVAPGPRPAVADVTP